MLNNKINFLSLSILINYQENIVFSYTFLIFLTINFSKSFIISLLSFEKSKVFISGRFRLLISKLSFQSLISNAFSNFSQFNLKFIFQVLSKLLNKVYILYFYFYIYQEILYIFFKKKLESS